MRGGRSWLEAGFDDIDVTVPPEPPRQTLIEMAVGNLAARKQPVPISADELEEVGRELYEGAFRREVLSRLMKAKKVERFTREHDYVYVYYVNKEIVCTVGCEEDVTDELLARLGLAMRFGGGSDVSTSNP